MDTITLPASTVISVPTTASIKQMNKETLKASLLGIVEGLGQKTEEGVNADHCSQANPDSPVTQSSVDNMHTHSNANSMMQQILNIVTMVKSQQETIENLQRQQNDCNTVLRSVSGDMLKIMTALDIDDIDSDDSMNDEIDAEQLKDILIVGDSMIRDIKATSDDLTIVSIGGAKFCHVKKHLKAIKPRNKQYKQLLLVCGTNEVSTKKTNEQIVKEVEQTLLLAKERAKEVHLSSVLPRLDDKVEQQKIDALNQLLVPLCNSLNVKFINNDLNFKYRDNTVDDSLLLPVDKLHLSFQGVTRLLQNCHMQEMAKPSMTDTPPKKTANAWSTPLTPPEAPTPPPERQDNPINGSIKFRGAKSSFSNFYPTPIHAWNITFKSVEHAYTYYKAMTMHEPVLADEILACRTAMNAKAIGDKITTNENWQNIKKNVMYFLLRQKAKQYRQFNGDLKASQNKILVEDTVNEYWARGKTGNGQNVLGRLLMTLRQDLPLCKDTPDSQRPFYDNSLQKVSQALPSPGPVPQYHHCPKFTPRTRYSRQNQINCFNCGEKSHTVDSCRHPYPLQCYGCSGEGHKQKVCPMNNSPQQPTGRTFPKPFYSR